MPRTNNKRFFQCYSWDGDERVRWGAARDNCGQHLGHVASRGWLVMAALLLVKILRQTLATSTYLYNTPWNYHNGNYNPTVKS